VPISSKYEFKFIHIPKTGGTSIEHVLGLRNEKSLFVSGIRTINIDGVMFSPQHLPHSEIIKRRPESKDWFSFSIVRNPYTRLLSEYIWDYKERNGKILESFNESSFNNWIDVELCKFDTDHKMTQCFLLDVPLDYIIRFENFKKGFHKLNSKLDTNFSLKWKNKSKFNKVELLNTLSDSTKSKIYSIYKEDFKRFKYKR